LGQVFVAVPAGEFGEEVVAQNEGDFLVVFFFHI
jgi:hypothetical protein